MRPFAFVDRDGTLVRDDGYTWRLEDYAPLPGAHRGLQLLAEANFGLVIVTNQSGIGRGYYTEADFARFQSRLAEDFAAHGAEILATYHCPHLPEAGCGCRKPAPGLIERACAEHDVDLAASWVIGDSDADIGLARGAGCRAIRIASGEDRDGVRCEPDLGAAARRILTQR